MPVEHIPGETYGQHAERVGDGPCLRCVGRSVSGPMTDPQPTRIWTGEQVNRLAEEVDRVALSSLAQPYVLPPRLAIRAANALRDFAATLERDLRSLEGSEGDPS